MPSQTMPKINLMKLPDPAAQTAKYVNMMNATRQQEASQRQADIAQKTLDLKTKEDVREEAKQGPTITKMEQDNLLQALTIFREGVTDIADGDLAAAEALRADLVARVPPYEKFILPASKWTPEYKFQLKTTAEQEIQKTIATPVASLEVTADGSPRSVQVGGPPGTAFQSPVYDAPETSAPAPQVAPRTPTAPPAAEAPNPFAAGYKPNSAAAPVNSLSLVVDSALETGVMAKADFDKLVRIAQPGSGPKLEAWTRQHNITISPDAPGVTDNQMRGAPANLPSQMAVSPMSYDGKTPPADFAVYRGQPMPSQTAGLAGAPPMQNTMLQTQPRTSTKLQPRNREVSPIPGIYSVPTGQVAATSQAQRSSPAEDAAKETARLQAAENFAKSNQDVLIDRKRQEVFAAKRAEKDADFLEAYTDTTSKSRTGLNVLDQMIGDARVEKGRIVIPKGGRAPHPGFEGVVGLGFPGVRFVQGTEAANFDGLLEQIKSNAFLKAFNDLRGGGSITVVEGDKATAALTRMSRAQSEIEFVRAAQEFRDTLRTGIKNADKRYTRLTGEAPEAAPARRRTPTKGSDGWGKAKVVGN